jgi:beta-galactosidase
MLDQPVNFTITKEGKWNQFTITTNNMINAGNYQLKLVVDHAKGLAISSIDLQ